MGNLVKSFKMAPFSLILPHFLDSPYKSSWGAHTTQPAGNYHFSIIIISSCFKSREWEDKRRNLWQLSDMLKFSRCEHSTRCGFFIIKSHLQRLWRMTTVFERFEAFKSHQWLWLLLWFLTHIISDAQIIILMSSSSLAVVLR
jgi:hypothetical protein